MINERKDNQTALSKSVSLGIFRHPLQWVIRSKVLNMFPEIPIFLYLGNNNKKKSRSPLHEWERPKREGVKRMDSVAGVSMNSQVRVVKVQGFFTGATFDHIKAELKKAYPAISNDLLAVYYDCRNGWLKVQNHSGYFPAGAADTLAQIAEPFRCDPPIKMAMPLPVGRGHKTTIKPLAREWLS